jgi:hypothetical protein
MSARSVWTQKDARHFALERDGLRVDLLYEGTGFQSGWAVYVGDRLIERCKEFMHARGVAITLAKPQAQAQ